MPDTVARRNPVSSSGCRGRDENDDLAFRVAVAQDVAVHRDRPGRRVLDGLVVFPVGADHVGSPQFGEARAARREVPEFTEAEPEKYGITSHMVVGPSLFALPGGIRRLEETALARAAEGLFSPVQAGKALAVREPSRPAALLGLNGLYDLPAPATADGLGASHAHLRDDYEKLLSGAFGTDEEAWPGASPAGFDRQYRTNVLGVFLTCQAFVKQVPGDGGSIVNISTSDISTNSPGSALYTSAKGAVTQLTRVLANELGGRNIRVNAVAAGATDTEASRAAGLVNDENVAGVSRITPLGRLGSPDAAWITGDVIFASGGLRCPFSRAEPGVLPVPTAVPCPGPRGAGELTALPLRPTHLTPGPRSGVHPAPPAARRREADGAWFTLPLACAALERWLTVRTRLVERAHGTSRLWVSLFANYDGTRHQHGQERSIGWLMHHRRLARDYETHPHRSEAMIQLAMIDLMARRLTGGNTTNWRGT
ncbi:hypothetical protein GCM10010145_67660 [Streptomyces ruber]|uniref:SDR family oxidoreductase n=2 Tax=Streptomyces TaxID=1883 RepID=A0A918EXY0_9ACTN|nr:hypothetical protein GCM10010145_67660 [Streptomyces ruber]